MYFRQYIHKLFTEATSSDELLFYFSGHGGQSAFGGYLLASDGTKWDPGISTNELITMANKCKAQQIVLIIDCCNSGQLGDIDILQAEKFQKAIIREGIAILAASTASQEAQEVKSHGRFTSVLIEGLKNATDLLGRVTMDTLYTYLKAYFGAWDQRPVFKSYTIDTFILRQGKARISPILIKYMMSLFKNKGDQYKVNKSFDNFQNPKANPDNVRTYKTILMPLRDAGLIEPVNAPSLWNSL